MKKFFIAMFSVIIIIAIGVSSFAVWDYNNPEVGCHVHHTQGMPMMTFSGPNYKFSVNEKNDKLGDKVRKIIKEYDKMYMSFDEKYKDCENNIDVTVTIKDDTTNFNFHGTINDGEKVIDYNEDLFFDFVVTEDYTGNCELEIKK